MSANPDTQQITLTVDKAAVKFFTEAAKKAGPGNTVTSEMRKTLHKRAGIKGDGAVRNWLPESVKAQLATKKTASKKAKPGKKKTAGKKKAKPVMPRPAKPATSKREAKTKK